MATSKSVACLAPLLLWAGVAQGASIACLGDSNTVFEVNWCTQTPDTRNYSQGGSTVVPNTRPPDDGAGLLESALADSDIETVIFAIGQNDIALSIVLPGWLAIPDVTPQVIAATMLDLVEIAEADGLEVFVGTVPPRFDPADVPGANLLIDELNGLLMDTGLMLIDFHTGFVLEDYGPDGAHFNQQGHDKRAQRVAEALPEPGTGMLVSLGLLALATRDRVSRTRRRLLPRRAGIARCSR